MENKVENMDQEEGMIKANNEITNPTSPPRSSDSDWSDINSDEEADITGDDDAVDRLRIVIGRNRQSTRSKKEPNFTELRNESYLTSTRNDEKQTNTPSSNAPPSSASPKNIKQDGNDKTGTLDWGDGNSIQIQSAIEQSRKGSKRGNYKRKIRYGGNTDVPNEILDAVAGAKGDNFNLRLDKAAKRMRLNRTQVKSVLRKLVESPDLINFAMEQAGDKPGASANAQVEPRITRKLAKHVVNSGGKLNWFLESVAQTPQKASSESLALLQEEFPEDDLDQEYDPTADIEALNIASAKARLETGLKNASDEENEGLSDIDVTPGKTSSIGGDESLTFKSPPSGFFSSDTPTLTASEDRTREIYDEEKSSNFLFKHPTSSNSPKCSISPSNIDENVTSSVVRSLNFDHQSVNQNTLKRKAKNVQFDLEVCNDGNSPIQQSRITRSKASFKNVSIDELAPMFFDQSTTNFPLDPDINFDVYETIEDEGEKIFQDFLKETFNQSSIPGEKECTNEESLIGEANDPDYEFNQLVEDQAPDEYRYNRSTKIPQKEVDCLMQELLEAYSLNKEQNSISTDSSSFTRSGKSRLEQDELQEPQQTESSKSKNTKQLMTSEQYGMIGQQMRQHIQMLTQMTLLTSHDPMWQNLNEHCKEMTNDLFSKSLIIKSTNQQHTTTSMFAQDNLFPSLGVVQEWEKLSLSPTEVQKTVKGEKYNISPKLMEFMANKSGAFIYPQLLPRSAINPLEDKMVFWSTGEDELIALQLEDYEKSNPSTKKSQASCLKNIHKHLIRNKTVPQIRSRYKNQTKKILVEKGKSDVNLSGNGNINAILHYKENKVAPRLSEFYQRIPYEGKIVWRKVRDMPLTEVPPVWKKYLLNLRGENDPLDEDSDLHDNKFLHEKLTSGNCEQMILRILVRKANFIETFKKYFQMDIIIFRIENTLPVKRTRVKH